jgi:hypothetical protein
MSNIVTAPRPRPTGHVLTPPETGRRVREFVKRRGLKVAAKVFMLDPHTIARVGAEFTVQAIVLDVIAEGLRMSEAELAQFERAYGKDS